MDPALCQKEQITLSPAQDSPEEHGWRRKLHLLTSKSNKTKRSA